MGGGQKLTKTKDNKMKLTVVKTYKDSKLCRVVTSGRFKYTSREASIIQGYASSFVVADPNDVKLQR